MVSERQYELYVLLPWPSWTDATTLRNLYQTQYGLDLSPLSFYGDMLMLILEQQADVRLQYGMEFRRAVPGNCREKANPLEKLVGKLFPQPELISLRENL